MVSPLRFTCDYQYDTVTVGVDDQSGVKLAVQALQALSIDIMIYK